MMRLYTTFYFLALATVTTYSAELEEFKLKNIKEWAGGPVKNLCITPKFPDQDSVMLVGAECDEHDNQYFKVDSDGRLVNTSTGTCVYTKTNDANVELLRLGPCEGGNQDRKFVYMTMDGALAIFYPDGPKYIAPQEKPPMDGFKVLRLRPRNYKRLAQRWKVVA